MSNTSEYGYAWEKLGTAVRCLAGSGTLTDRLIDAYSAGVTRLRPPVWQPPDELVPRLEPLHAAIGDEPITQRIAAMTEEERQTLAHEFVRTYAFVCAKVGYGY
jgi:hypothetical protein